MQPRAGTMQVTRMGPWGWREDEAGVTQGLRMDDSWSEARLLCRLRLEKKSKGENEERRCTDFTGSILPERLSGCL
jgi:hypothetical protein